MLIKKWEEIPEFMRNDEVRYYYDILHKKKINLYVKRLFDITASLLLILLLFPVMVIIAIWIKADSKGPVFFIQTRITQYGKLFHIFKFRTMVVDADKNGTLVTSKNDNRITKVGKKIRKYRLDEIPQVFNVLFGQMSFVGTRPEVQKYVKAYSVEMKATLLLPAGITSLASIKYKEEDEIISQFVNEFKSIDEVYIKKILPEKMKFNLEYLKFINIFNDIYICVKTLL